MHVPRSLACFALFVALAACGGGGGDSSNGGGPGPDPGSCTTSMTAAEEALAMQVLTLVNAERSANGLAAVGWSSCAAETAYQHSVDMDVRAFFAHTNPSGQDPGDRLTADGIGWSTYGENIYWSAPTATPAQAMAAWMASPGHRANILNPAFAYLGVGVHDAGGSEAWWTQVFYTP